MARKSGFIRRGGKMIRETSWLAGLFQETTIAAASTATIITTLNAAALALRPFTIVRTRGVVGIRSDQISASESYSAIYAQLVVSEQAAAVGVTAIPTPVTENGSDYFYVMETLFGAVQFLSAVGAFINGSETDRVFDSRAMRKVEDGMDIVTVVETTAASNGAIVKTFQRTLIKLH